MSTSEEEADKGSKSKMIKNPDVDTSFLPDRDREDAENRLREELRQVREHIIGVPVKRMKDLNLNMNRSK